MSAAEFFLMGGLSAVVLAALAWTGDRRRLRRQNLDRVGFVPWTMLFFWMLLAAIILLGLALRASLAA